MSLRIQDPSSRKSFGITWPILLHISLETCPYMIAYCCSFYLASSGKLSQAWVKTISARASRGNIAELWQDHKWSVHTSHGNTWASRMSDFAFVTLGFELLDWFSLKKYLFSKIALLSRPPFTGVPNGPGRKVPQRVFLECFWALASKNAWALLGIPNAKAFFRALFGALRARRPKALQKHCLGTF